MKLFANTEIISAGENFSSYQQASLAFCNHRISSIEKGCIITVIHIYCIAEILLLRSEIFSYSLLCNAIDAVLILYDSANAPKHIQHLSLKLSLETSRKKPSPCNYVTPRNVFLAFLSSTAGKGKDGDQRQARNEGKGTDNLANETSRIAVK